MPLTKKPLDFKNNQEEAKKWADEEFKTWKDVLHNYNFQAKLKHFIKYDEKFVNEYLTVLKGKRIKNLDQMPPLLKEKYPNLNKEKLDYYNEQINELEIVLSKNKLQKDLKVYVRVIPAKFLGKILVINGKVIPPLFDFLKSNYFKGKIETKYNFLTGSLTYDGNPNFPAKYYPVILEILLPKNTEVGYIGMEKQKFNGQDIIINRGYNWEVKKVKIINLNGQENIKISLKLII